MERDPEDDEESCDPDYPLHYYAYQSEDWITPFDLWRYWPHEWDKMAKVLTCYFNAEENDLDLDASIQVYVMSNLHLDRLNDETQCFIPVNGETMDFELRFSAELGLDDNSYIGFIVRDAALNWVCNTALFFGNAEEEPEGNDWGIPEPPRMYCIPVWWDGRNNEDPIDPGHFVDPDQGRYQAYVVVIDSHGSIFSNVEFFDAVPSIDSVLLTHHPFYPPTREYPTTVYSVIRGKIDDSEDPSLDYRYYIPPPDPPYQNPASLEFWKNEQNDNYFEFWDIDHKRFYEKNNSQTLDLVEWDPQKFGELQYRWFAIKDQRIGTSNQVSYENVVDTTDQWGDTWNIELIRPGMWWRPENNPYMRILTYSEIDNVKNGYILQSSRSATGADAHKLIFMDETADLPYPDRVDWAVSHIGVPYTYGIKTPYISNDCGGFITTCRIEELLPGNPHDLSIDRIASIDYYDGDLPYGEHRHFTEIIPDPRQDPYPDPGYSGMILFIHERLDKYGNPIEHPWNGHRHILLVQNLKFDDQFPDTPIPEVCRAFHERGGTHAAHRGRVNFENAVREYAPYFDIEGYRDNNWVWTFLRFTR